MDFIIKVLHIEDSKFVVKTLENTLEEVVRDFDIGLDFTWLQNLNNIYDIIMDTQPHILILDLMLENENSFEYIQNLHLIQPDMIIIVISSQKDIRTAFNTLDRGASHYIIKDEGMINDFQMSLFTSIEKILLKAKLSTLESMIYDPNTYPMVLFHITEIGPNVRLKDFEEFPVVLDKPLNDFLLLHGVSLYVAIGQNDNYHEGVFFLPAGSSKMHSLVISFRLPNPNAVDDRLNIGYYFISLFIPDNMIRYFPKIHKLLFLIEDIKVKLYSSENINNDTMDKIKKYIFDKIVEIGF